MSARSFQIPDRYEPATKKYSGGQGQVLVCKDTFLNRPVAIKYIKDVADRDTMQREIAALSEIRSKHVVQIYDFIDDRKAKDAGIVQEYLPGKDLSEFAGGGIKTLSVYLKTLYQIGCGIADIHSHGKIHRDIKPINMKFDSEGILKIFDFGLSCDGDPEPETTAGRGSHVYRAPELYYSPAKFTAAVDTYAFGVSAWEILNPKFPRGFLEIPPFDPTPAPSFSTHAIGLPSEIASILDQALKIDPAARPPMATVRDIIQTRLLFGKHEGRLTYDDKVLEIEGIDKSIGVKTRGYGGFTLVYDGFAFRLSGISGKVSINNIPATENVSLPGSCVIAISSEVEGEYPRYLTFDVSHPEVIL